MADMARDASDRLCDILERFKLAELYVFGSRAQEVASKLGKGQFLLDSTHSDLDIGVRSPEHSLSAQSRVDLTIELEDLFDVPRVDLVVLEEASAFLALDVIRGELLCARDLDEQARYELFVLRRAGDLLPFQREREKMVLREGAR